MISPYSYNILQVSYLMSLIFFFFFNPALMALSSTTLDSMLRCSNEEKNLQATAICQQHEIA